MSKVTIRKAATSDIKAISRVHRHSIVELCSDDYTAEQIDAWGRRPFNGEARADAIKDNDMWVAELDGQVEGYCELGLFPDDNHGEILGLYLTSAITGRGVGTKLFEIAKKRVIDAGLSKILLYSTITAQEFYTKLGFMTIKEDTSVQIRGVKIPAVSMALKL